LADPDPKKARYPEISGSDTGSGSGYPKMSNYPPTLLGMERKVGQKSRLGK